MKRTLQSVWSPQRRNRRDVDVYLPRSYRTDIKRLYPVVYMQDGQNLSDPTTSFAGTWDLEPTLERLDARGLEAIIVGVHHAGLVLSSPDPDRLEQLIGEYTERFYRDFYATVPPPERPLE